MLSRKDFIEIAKIIRKSSQEISDQKTLNKKCLTEILYNNFVEWLQTTNIRFNQEKFRAECFK